MGIPSLGTRGSGGSRRSLGWSNAVVDPVHIIGHTGVDSWLVEPPTAIAPADDAIQVSHTILLTDQRPT